MYASTLSGSLASYRRSPAPQQDVEVFAAEQAGALQVRLKLAVDCSVRYTTGV